MLSEKQKNNLGYFVGKVCTIFVPEINRKFDEKTNIEYFVGRVTEIDDEGLWFENISNKKMNFFFFNFIVGIAEETFVQSED